MSEFIWNLSDPLQVGAVGVDVATKTDTGTLTTRLGQLEGALSRQLLVSQALWEILRERLEITEEELLAKIREVDLRDGSLDGRMSPQVTTCPQCGHKINTKHTRCIYCGTDIQKPHVFQ